MFFIVGDPQPAFDKTRKGRQRFRSLAQVAIDRFERQLDGKVLPDPPTPGLGDVFLLPTFVAELVAIDRLAQWERAKLAPYLGHGLPLASDAVTSLRKRVTERPDEFLVNGPSVSALYDRVAQARVSAFRFNIELGCELLIGQVEEDELVDVVARLLLELYKES